MKFCKKASIVAVFVIPINVNAALIDNGYYTTDNINGLEWLDLNLTAGLSIDAVLGDAGGFISGGWSYATFSQVASLYSEAGAAPSLSGQMVTDPGVILAAQNLNNLLGTLSPSVTFGSDPTVFYGSSSFAMSDNGLFASQFVYQVAEDASQGRLWNTSSWYQYAPNQWNGINPSIGHYLVRNTTSPVPLPAALWLFSSGLIGLGAFYRRKKISNT